MNSDRPNPYAPPVARHDDRTRLTFDAVIDVSDYAALLSRRDFESVLLWILFLLLLLTTAMFGMASVSLLIRFGLDLAAVLASVFSLVFFVGAVFVHLYTRPMRRARRKLKRFPGLLGVARGSLDVSGLCFFDGERHAWFSPQHLISSRVSPAGVYVQFDEETDHFLPLTSQTFDGYSESVASRILQRWREAPTADSNRGTGGLECLTASSPVANEVIAFSGAVTIRKPARTPQLRQQAIIETTSSAVGLLTGVLGWGVFDDWLCYSALLIGSLGLISATRLWRRYFFVSDTLSWDQRGWITNRELAIEWQGRGVRISLREMEHIADQDAVVELTDNRNIRYYLFHDHVSGTADWAQLVNWCRSAVRAPPGG